MSLQKTATEDDVPVRQVNNILQNLRGEHFRHARNTQGKVVSISSLSSQPTLPVGLIYPTPHVPASDHSTRIPGPSPPKSWRSHPIPISTTSGQSSVTSNTPAWRAHALALFFATHLPASPSAPAPRVIYPDPNPIPTLTLLCLQLLRTACPSADLADIAPYIPRHLCRALLRYTAVHAPLSQIELDALCQGTTHVDTELLLIGPRNTFRAHAPDPLQRDDALAETWDAVEALDTDESAALRSLAVVSSPLSAATVLAFPPTITHLALIDVPRWLALWRLPTICPLVVFLDLSYNTWLRADERGRGAPVLEEVGWNGLRRLEVLGLRGCHVTPKVLLELNRGRWEEVRVIQ
ncbi:hypothetical protein JVU11DRAFT_961 [Chiua virens]|nr:hypothetical protein JVU11DRAFT_961 [Chiua virens]